MGRRKSELSTRLPQSFQVPDYEYWSRDQLIARLIILDEMTAGSEASKMLSRLPIYLSPSQAAILELLITAYPLPVSYDKLITYGVANSKESLGAIRTYLERKTKPLGIVVSSVWGRGFVLLPKAYEKIKELAHENRVDRDDRSNGAVSTGNLVTEKQDVKI